VAPKGVIVATTPSRRAGRRELDPARLLIEERLSGR